MLWRLGGASYGGEAALRRLGGTPEAQPVAVAAGVVLKADRVVRHTRLVAPAKRAVLAHVVPPG